MSGGHQSILLMVTIVSMSVAMSTVTISAGSISTMHVMFVAAVVSSVGGLRRSPVVVPISVVPMVISAIVAVAVLVSIVIVPVMMIAIAMMVIVMFMDAMIRPTVSTILMASPVLKVVMFLVGISQLIVRVLMGVSFVSVLMLVRMIMVMRMLVSALVGDLRPVSLVISFVLHDLPSSVWK